MILLRLFATLLLAIALPRVALAQNHITPTLVAESMNPTAGGETTLAFVMRPEPNWHGYWKNPGDAGVETSVEWTAPGGLSFGPLTYPVPHTLLIAGLMNYVYEGEHALLATVKVPAGLAPGTRLPIVAKLDWLACDPSVCVPETATMRIALVVGDGARPNAAAFDRYRAAIPRPLGSPARFAVAGDRFRLEVPLPADAAIEEPYFFPLTDGVIDYAAPQRVGRDADRLVIETSARPGANPTALEGVLRIGKDTGVSFSAAPGEVAPAPDAAGATATKGNAGAVLLTFAAAMLGGLLLNIMPCVFPILSLKALSLARAGESARGARIEALAYTGGVVLVCALLGAALLGVRAAGVEAGWAFQLQDPRVIAVLMLLVLAIGLNLAGLFELPTIGAGSGLAASGGPAGAFWTGALAAFVATPCAGPFLGTALGAAVLLPPVQAMAIFVGLGLGLALPFLLIGFVPAIRARMPRPGPWMNTFRHILAVPMLVTALGLAWVLGRQAQVNGMTLGLGAALLLALGLWWTGRRQAGLKRGAWWPALPALLAALALAGTVQPAAAAPEQAHGEAFSETRLAELRAEGRPVFLYFTADWCLSCKVNEKAAIERDEVEAAFKAKNVAVMIGDWTRGDPAISRFLAQHGRSGVPFYLFYPAGGGNPRELPQLLTPGLLTSL